MNWFEKNARRLTELVVDEQQALSGPLIAKENTVSWLEKTKTAGWFGPSDEAQQTQNNQYRISAIEGAIQALLVQQQDPGIAQVIVQLNALK